MANIQEAIEYSKKNPTSAFANELKRRIESGQMDTELKSAGLTQYMSQPAGGLSRVADVYTKNLKEQALGGVQTAQKTLGMGVDTMQQAQQMPMETQSQRDKTFGTAAAGAGQIGLGAMSGVIQTAFSPVTAAVLTGIQGYKELDQATGGTMKNQIDKVAQENPEMIQKISDYIIQNPKKVQAASDMLNVLTAGTGAKPLATTASDLTKGITTGVKEIVPTIKNSTDIKNIVPTKLGQKAVDLISADPGKKVETILKRSTPEELNNYLSIAEKSSLSGEAKSVFETVGDKMFDTTKILQSKLSEIGKAKSAVVEPLREGLSAFKTETKPLIEKLTSLKNSFGEIDKANAPKVQAVIDDAKAVSTKLDADKFIDKIQGALYSGNMDLTIPRGSTLDKQLRGILGEYNNSLKASLPAEYTTLNNQYAKLVDSLDTVNRSLGEVVEGVPVRGASLIKQYFSPSGSKAKEIFEFIKKETNGQVDLAKEATLAKFAGQLYDDANVNSLLGGIKDIPTSLGAAAGRLIEKVGGEKIESAMRQSTIRKARGKFSPKLEEGSSLKTTTPTELKVSPSTQSTPSTPKGKGIKLNAGFIDPSALFAKNPVKINNIVKNISSDDVTFLKYFTKNSENGTLTKEIRNSMDDFLGQIGITAKTKDEQATVANMLLEKYNSKK